MRESRSLGSVGAKAEWLSYPTIRGKQCAGQLLCCLFFLGALSPPAQAQTPGLELPSVRLGVEEGGNTTYTVALATAPTATVTVAIAGSEDVTTMPTSLTFTTTDWSTAQTVRVSAAEDDDSENDHSLLTHTASGGGYDSLGSVSLVVDVRDNDAGVDGTMTVTAARTEIIEGEQVSFVVQLSPTVVSEDSFSPDYSWRP